MGSAAARWALAAGALGAAGVAAWLLSSTGPGPGERQDGKPPPGPVRVGSGDGRSPPAPPAPAPAPRPDDDTAAPAANGAPPPPPPAPGPAVAERVRRPLSDVHWDGVPLVRAFEDVGKRIGVEIAYESEELQEWCGKREIRCRLGSTAASRILDLLVASAGPAPSGNVLRWEDSGGKILLTSRAPAPRPEPRPEAGKDE